MGPASALTKTFTLKKLALFFEKLKKTRLEWGEWSIKRANGGRKQGEKTNWIRWAAAAADQ